MPLSYDELYEFLYSLHLTEKPEMDNIDVAANISSEKNLAVFGEILNRFAVKWCNFTTTAEISQLKHKPKLVVCDLTSSPGAPPHVDDVPMVAIADPRAQADCAQRMCMMSSSVHE